MTAPTKVPLGLVDSSILDRANHTGTQAISTVTDLADLVDIGDLLASGSLTTANSMNISVPSQAYTKLVLLIEGISFDTASRHIIVRQNGDNSGYRGLITHGTTPYGISTFFCNHSSQAGAETANLQITFENYQSGLYTRTSIDGACKIGGTPDSVAGSCVRMSSDALSTINLVMNDTGNIDAGTYKLMGIGKHTATVFPS